MQKLIINHSGFSIIADKKRTPAKTTITLNFVTNGVDFKELNTEANFEKCLNKDLTLALVENFKLKHGKLPKNFTMINNVLKYSAKEYNFSEFLDGAGNLINSYYKTKEVYEVVVSDKFGKVLNTIPCKNVFEAEEVFYKNVNTHSARAGNVFAKINKIVI